MPSSTVLQPEEWNWRLDGVRGEDRGDLLSLEPGIKGKRGEGPRLVLSELSIYQSSLGAANGETQDLFLPDPCWILLPSSCQGNSGARDTRQHLAMPQHFYLCKGDAFKTHPPDAIKMSFLSSTGQKPGETKTFTGDPRVLEPGFQLSLLLSSHPGAMRAWSSQG